MTRQNADKSRNNKKIAPYGDWPSMISAELIVSDSLSLDEPRVSTDFIYYIERRPNESGRCVIVKASTDGQHRIDILPEPYSARSRAHEYGGGCYCISDDDKLIFFINDKDQDIYYISGNPIKANKVNRVTHAANKRFADFVYDKQRNQLIAVCESHEKETVENSIVAIDVNSGHTTTLTHGHDFYASPRLNGAANKLCWQSWDHPNMPWDGNQLWLADIDDNGTLNRPILIAGGAEISTFQPQWSPDEILYYISDDTGWWHLYRHIDKKPVSHNEQLTHGEKEFGLPQWVFAQSTYAFINTTSIDDTTIVCSYQSHGKATLAMLSLDAEKDALPPLTTIPTPWQEYSAIVTSTVEAKHGKSEHHFCFIAASDESFPQLISATISDDKKDSASGYGAIIRSTESIQTSCQLPLSVDNYSKVQTIVFKNRHGEKVYANYYPPNNPAYRADESQQPPLITLCHGGPTGQSSIALDPKKQFWTSRGFALLDVNYSGSTGYGREYRSRLNNKWGLLDVEDCCDGALYAISQNLADKNQLIIRGSSAGGYTVLSALTFQSVFAAGASYYGISELCSLASDTHKFEAHYLDHMIGPYPESKDIYEQRSPINHAEQMNCPVIFFQGIDDKVVPKEQAEKMFNALDKLKLPVAAQYFEGEQHGFRKAETIMLALENELCFYQLIFDLKAKDKLTFKGDIQLKNI
jgi:dipeptidyl aminopeptidase/acylaminoacyl peptidase